MLRPKSPILDISAHGKFFELGAQCYSIYTKGTSVILKRNVFTAKLVVILYSKLNHYAMHDVYSGNQF